MFKNHGPTWPRGGVEDGEDGPVLKEGYSSTPSDPLVIYKCSKDVCKGTRVFSVMKMRANSRRWKSLMVKNHCQAFWHLLTLGVFWCCFVYTSMWCGIPWVLLPFDGFDGFRKFCRYKQSPPVWNCIPYRFTLAESGCWKSSICHPKHVDVCFLVVIESFHFTKCFHQLSFFGVLNVHVFLLQEIFNRIPTGRGIYWISWIF